MTCSPWRVRLRANHLDACCSAALSLFRSVQSTARCRSRCARPAGGKEPLQVPLLTLFTMPVTTCSDPRCWSGQLYRAGNVVRIPSTRVGGRTGQGADPALPTGRRDALGGLGAGGAAEPYAVSAASASPASPRPALSPAPRRLLTSLVRQTPSSTACSPSSRSHPVPSTTASASSGLCS